MSNNVTAFYQTLAVAASEASAALVGTTALMNCVYRDFKPEAATPGQTLNVPIPVAPGPTGPADIGVGDFTTTDITYNTQPIVFNKHPGFAYVVRNFEQFNSPEDIRNLFLDAGVKGMAEYVNAQIAALITSANFNSYTTVQGAGAATVGQSDITKLWSNLATGKVPVRDLGNLFFVTHPVVYGNMMSSTFWSANSQVGYQLAGTIRRAALLGQQFGAVTDFDQQMPAVVGTAVTGTSVGVTNASAAVTGSATAFTTQLVAGEYLVFASDTTATPYQILSITDNTHLTLTTNYAGSTNAATSATIFSYTSFLFHRHAIAAAYRPLPEPDGRVVFYTYLDYMGLPILVQFGWNQLKNAWVVTLDAGYGLAVIRKDHGSMMIS